MQTLHATHNRAGEITYVHAPSATQQFRYEFTVTTYTNTVGSNVADRDSVTIDWGDGTFLSIARANGTDSDGNGVPNGVALTNGIRKNEYVAIHAFPGFAPFYVITISDPNRNAGIVNINGGSSVDIEFYLEDTLFVPNPQFFGFNSSPVLELEPIDYAQLGEPFIHNPTAYDSDGDSLVFTLVQPLAFQGEPVTNYRFPNEVAPGPQNNLSLNSLTGELIWDSPQVIGEYNIAFLITEYRAGVKMGTMIRDMQIDVSDTGNKPPELDPISDTCIWLGDTIRRVFFATDDGEPEPTQQVTISAFGGPLELDNPATFTPMNGANMASGIFEWATDCSHVFSDDYTIVVKAEDDFVFANTPIPLTDLQTWRLTVVVPPPTGLQAETIGGEIILSWDEFYVCGESDKFIGYSVWRSVGCDSMVFDQCQRGLTETSYVRIAQQIQDTIYIDDSAIKGLNYSYRIVADFADANSGQGFPINVISSHPSSNACAFLPADLPIITHVSVEKTGVTDGEMLIRWTKPDPIALDTVVNIPPYTYEVWRAAAAPNNFSQITSFTVNSFAEANDTFFVDSGLNTDGIEYFYKIRFLASGDDDLGETETAGSVFLESASGNEMITLFWTEEVPWLNREYVVFKSTVLTGPYDSLTTVNANSFTEEDLINGETYCYQIKAKGSYFSPGITDPLINYSQMHCAVPVDTIPPCPLELSIVNGCDDVYIDEMYYNLLDWENVCGDDDIAFYSLYNIPLGDSIGVEIAVLPEEENRFRQDLIETLSGCYFITATDVFGNVSMSSDTVCQANCLIYELPNTFTPNGDAQNELFVPRAGFRFVNSVEFKVFNQWGNLVFETNNPELLWDGLDGQTSKVLPEAVYYYTCKVFEQSGNGTAVLNSNLSGNIHLFRE